MKTNPFYIDAYEELSAHFEQSLGISSSDRKPNSIVEFASRLSEKLGLSFVGGEFPSPGGVAESRGGRNRVPATRIRRKTQSYMNLPFNPALKERAKKLRKAGNLSEVLFWNQVKNKRFKGFDFDRQKIVGNYIVDFYCSNCDVVIEIDGSSHDNKQEYDAQRDAFLESLGLTVIHIRVSDVLKNMSAVMAALFDHPALAGTPPGEGNFSSEGAGEVTTPANILDYIFAMWHSKGFRERTIDVREMDFSEFPCPEDKEKFWRLVELGREIRLIQALDADVEDDFTSDFPISGNNLISQPRFLKENCENGMGRVYINENQYFDNVPEEVWQCRIGGIFPAQKWLSERENCVLERGDILLYQKVITALKETLRKLQNLELLK